MNMLANELQTKLQKLNQQPLTAGELVLLARAISDEIPCPCKDMDNMHMYVLGYKMFVIDVVGCINDYTYINENSVDDILDLIENFLLWRYNVAHNPPAVLFFSGECCVIDELSLLPRYVDKAKLLSVGDGYDNANYTYAMFRELAISKYTIKSQ